MQAWAFFYLQQQQKQCFGSDGWSLCHWHHKCQVVGGLFLLYRLRSIFEASFPSKCMVVMTSSAHKALCYIQQGAKRSDGKVISGFNSHVLLPAFISQIKGWRAFNRSWKSLMAKNALLQNFVLPRPIYWWRRCWWRNHSSYRDSVCRWLLNLLLKRRSRAWLSRVMLLAFGCCPGRQSQWCIGWNSSIASGDRTVLCVCEMQLWLWFAALLHRLVELR